MRLQTEELKRQFRAAQRRVPQLESDQKKLDMLERVPHLT